MQAVGLLVHAAKSVFLSVITLFDGPSCPLFEGSLGVG
jgi:hypothetical protein